MKGCFFVVLVFAICASAKRRSEASPSFFEEDPPASTKDLLDFEKPHPPVERFSRGSRLLAGSETTPSNKSRRNRNRSQDRFGVKTNIEQDDQFAICNTRSNTNVTDKDGTIGGSRGLSYSEGSEGLKRLVCKSKSYRITNRNGNLKRVAAEGTAVLSNDKDIERLLNSHRTSAKHFEIGSSGRSGISSRANKKDIVSAIETQGKGAGSSALTKSRLVPHGIETMGQADGRTTMEKKGMGMRSWGREATHIVSNPRGSSRRSPGRGSGETLAHMSHHKKSNFEIDI